MGRILIVGAGPAGISTALFLAKRGISSKLIDKESFPRDKICGDGLSGWVLSMLHKLDMGLVDDLADNTAALPSWGVKFYAPNLKSITLPYVNKKRPNEAPGYVIRRKTFDQMLYQKAADNKLITILENWKVSDFKYSGNEVILTDDSGSRTLIGDLVVFSDGANSKFARELAGIVKEDKHHATGIKAYYSGIKAYGPSGLKAYGLGLKDKEMEEVAGSEGPTSESRTPNPESRILNPESPNPEFLNPVEFYFLKSVLPGYLWIFPLPNGEANVGLGIRTDIMKKKKINLKSEMLRCIEETPILKERFAGAKMTSPVEAWGLPLGSKKRNISGDRFLITGDSASLIDPFTGEGVGNAMNTGFHAAEHIAESIENQRFDAVFNRMYDKRVYDKLWKELRISSAIQKLLVRPTLFSWVMNKTVENEFLRQSFIKMIDDLDERKKLKRPGFYFKVLFSKSS